MTAREYLWQLTELSHKIKQDEDEIVRLRLDAAGIRGMTYDGAKVQSTASSDQLINAMIRIEAMEDRYAQRMAERAYFRQQIIDQIQALPNGLYGAVLYKRYVESKTFGRISRELRYSRDRIYHVHGEALEEFEHIYAPLKKIAAIDYLDKQ